MKQVKSDKYELNIDGLPNKCPFCFHSITPNPIYAIFLEKFHTQELRVLMQCPNIDCMEGFLGAYYKDYKQNYYIFQGSVSKGNTETKSFKEVIKNISPAFANIYNEAYAAEQNKLLEICGVGYRKSLEFLIKDYCILKNPEKQDSIRKQMLMPVIENFVNNQNIQSVATRATWLGNDQTHYTRRWNDKDLNDLKILIDLTVHWIEMEVLTQDFESSMKK